MGFLMQMSLKLRRSRLGGRVICITAAWAAEGKVGVEIEELFKGI